MIKPWRCKGCGAHLGKVTRNGNEVHQLLLFREAVDTKREEVADVDVIALSSLSGAHDYLFPKVMELLQEREAGDILVIGGGIIPEEDVPMLKEQGVQEVFSPGTPMEDILKTFRKL